jgi:two-component system osmolarity sensor histidine kinase EnvZ
MLSGISHDLRTPLTRLKLQLAMLNQKEISKNMSKDIDEMEKMLNDYLQFAKNQVYEESSPIDIKDLFIELVENFKNNKIQLLNNEEIFLVGRKNALKRCLNNLIQNSLTHAENVFINSSKTISRLVILIEDDGPGIPAEQYRNVFKPFYRLDKSRSLNKSGVGLGLSIAKDIINSHGGSILLGKSTYEGLQIKISLPL